MEADWSLVGERQEVPRGKHVLIAGAGIAGLTAARILQASGFEVTLLEARDRLGGRIWTRELGDTPVDLGASWIHEARRNPLVTLCRRAGIGLMSSPRSPLCFYEAGRCTPFPRMVWQHRRALYRLVGRYLMERIRHRWGTDCALEEALRPVLERVSDTRFLHWLLAMIENIHGAPADRIRLRLWDPREAWGENLIPQGGYGRLITWLARPLKRIRLSTDVREVWYDGEGVRVRTNRGHYSGDVLLITVPLGILKAGCIRFTPPLPKRKQLAIKRIGYGEGSVLNKLVMYFPEPVFPLDVTRYAALPESPEKRGAFPIWVASNARVVTGFLGGKIAAHWDIEGKDLSEEGRRRLEHMFGHAFPEPVISIATRWLHDPWARGSYSYEAVGQARSDRLELQKPVGRRVFFAGEAVHPLHYGTVHGALLSAEAASRAIVEACTGMPADLSRLPWRRGTKKGPL